MAFCLIKSEAEKFRKALKDGTIDPAKLSVMSSEQRRAFFEKIVDPTNAAQINALFESKILLKNKKAGMVSWAKKSLGITPQVQRDIMTKIERLSEKELLNPKTLEDFKEDLVRTRLGLNLTFEEAQTINTMSEERTQAKEAWEAELKSNPQWSENPHNTRKEWIDNKARLQYGLKQVIVENYVNKIKLRDRKITFKQDPVAASIAAVKEIPGIMKSLMASLDNSFFGRQGIKNLYGSVEQKRIWSRNFVKSFRDMALELKGGGINGVSVLDTIKADIYSRPNALNNKYKTGGYRLDVLTEEAFPSSLPSKIPVLGRLFEASETAYNGAALRMRADLADLLIAKAEAFGVNTLNSQEARGIGNLVGSLTGRGNLGKAETIASDLNVLLFSVRFMKSNIDTLTAHQFDAKATPFVKSEARKQLISIIAHVAGILTIAKLIDPESVDEDPRSTNFGKVKMFGSWVDITGGIGSLARLAAQVSPTQRNGEWGSWAKSQSGNWTNLTAGEYGQRDAIDVIVDGMFLNKLSPVASIVRDAGRGEMFGGEPFNITKSIINSLTPLSIQRYVDLKDEEYSVILGVMAAEFFGLSSSSYKYNNDWSSRKSVEMRTFKEQVGEEKFKKANEDYNRAYNAWFDEVQKDSKYKKLSDDAKADLATSAKAAIKDKILKENGYKKKKTSKTDTEKQESKTVKALKP